MTGIEQATQAIDFAAEWARLFLETLGALTVSGNAALESTLCSKFVCFMLPMSCPFGPT